MSPDSRTQEPDESDGRVLRRHRTRRAVVDALLALLHEGVIRPTAPEIAERAGVSVRSIGQNFGSQEQLFEFASAVLVERVAQSLPRESAGDDPVVTLVAQRSAFAEATSQVRRAAVVLGSSPALDATAKAWRRARRNELERLFVDRLGKLTELEKRDALRSLEGMVSAALWDELRGGMGLSRADAERVMVTSVRAILDKASVTPMGRRQ